MKEPKPNLVFDLLLFSFVGAFLVAVVFVLVLPAALPPTDGAYMSWGLLFDPLALMVTSLGAGIGGLFASILALIFLRRTDLNRTSRFTYTVVVATVVVIGPLFGVINLAAAFVALFLSVLYCKRRYPLAERVSQITE